MVDAGGRHLFWGKGNFFVSSNFYDAALAGNNLIETSPVLKFDGDYLISDTCFSAAFQMIEASLRNSI